MRRQIALATTRACFLVAVCAILVGCAKRKHKQLVAPAGCLAPEMVACFQEYAYDELSERDLARLGKEGLLKCVSKDLKVLGQQSTCLPLELGKDDQQRSVIVWFKCSDLCPAQGSIKAGYASVSKEECCARGDYAFTDFAWGERYAGCSPISLMDAYIEASGSKGVSFCERERAR
jgi:hypothetical protein